MGNTVNPSSGVGTSSLTVTIVPTTSNTYSLLTASGSGETDSIAFEQYDIIDIDPDGDAIPICESVTYEVDVDKVEYHIYDDEDGTLIYAGYAYRYPDDEDNLKIELNDVLSDFLRNHISFTEGLQKMDSFYKTFIIMTIYGSGEKQVYNAGLKPQRPILNEPISNEIDPRQYLFINYIDAYGNLSIYKNGSEIDGLGSIGGAVYVVPRTDAVCGEEVGFDIRQDSNVVAAQNYVYKGTNKNYALYYINAYGGWDSLAIRGNVTRTDNIQSQTYKNKTNGKVKYLNTSTATWQLYTDDMNDGSRMHHLLESNEVYLHNLETDEIVPVVITDSNCVYKNYANQGNTRFHYTINVEASNYKIRK